MPAAFSSICIYIKSELEIPDRAQKEEEMPVP